MPILSKGVSLMPPWNLNRENTALCFIPILWIEKCCFHSVPGAGKMRLIPITRCLPWNEKGPRLAVVYNEEGKTRMFVYDAVNRVKLYKQELPQFTQIQDM